MYLHLDDGHIGKHWGSQSSCLSFEEWVVGLLVAVHLEEWVRGVIFLEDDLFFVILGTPGTKLISAE